MDKLRLRFEKTGRAVYISHLDLMHTMQRAFSRAGCELRYSEGFNPHPQISILLPLPVGMASRCEIMDFRLKEEADLSALPRRLSAVLPEGIRVIEAYEQQRKAAELKWLKIGGLLEYDGGITEELIEGLRAFYSRDEIVITKKTKRGLGQADIRPQIKSLSLCPGEGSVRLEAVISAQEPTLNPNLLTEALSQLAPELTPDFARFTRLETYDGQMDIYR